VGEPVLVEHDLARERPVAVERPGSGGFHPEPDLFSLTLIELDDVFLVVDMFIMAIPDRRLNLAGFVFVGVFVVPRRGCVLDFALFVFMGVVVMHRFMEVTAFNLMRVFTVFRGEFGSLGFVTVLSVIVAFLFPCGRHPRIFGRGCGED
jgi:hypothetical protein